MDKILHFDNDTKLSDCDINAFRIGQNLLTKHGRFGNAVIVGFIEGGYTVLTDFGNQVDLGYEEVARIFDLESTCLMVCFVYDRLQAQIDLLTAAQQRLGELHG